MAERPDIRIVGNKAEIPPEDIWNWQRTLEKGGFTQEEIDSILVPLSRDYAWAKVNAQLETIIQNTLETDGHLMTEEQRKTYADDVRKAFRRQMESGFLKK